MNYWIISNGHSRIIIQAGDEHAARHQIEVRWGNHRFCSATPYIGAGK